MYCPRVSRISTLMLLVLGLVITASIGCGPSENADAQKSSPNEVPRNVRVLAIETADLNEYLTVSGRISPLRGTDLCAEEAGQVEEIPNDKGMLVGTDAVLVQLDDGLLAASFKSATANKELASYNESRIRQLFDANSVSGIEMLDAQTKLKDAEAAMEIAQIRLDNTAIRSPYAGLITDRYVEIGQLVSPGMPVARIADPHTLKLTGSVSEREVHLLKAGGAAELFVEGFEDPIAATIYWVGFEAVPMTGKFKVEIHIDNQNLAIRPGVVGSARILKSVHKNVILIPRDALMQRAGNSYVYVVEDGRARERNVKLGADQGLMAIVIDGLRGGEKLVVRGQRDLRDSSAVLITETADAADGSQSTDPSVVTQLHTVDLPWQEKTQPRGATR